MTSENKSVELASRASESRLGTVGSALKRVGVATVAVLLAGGVALPAVAMNVGDDTGAQSLASNYAGQEQNFEVSPELEAALALIPDEIEATSPEELEEIRQRAEEEAEREAAEEETSQNSQPSNPAPAPPISSNAGGIVGTAQSMLGVPYVYGGNTPAGFDCSGFTQWVFAQHGISLPRTSGAQSSVGTPVPVSDVQPGDLIVWPGHTGIYAGNGQMIHAPTAGKTVSYVSFSAMVNAMGTPEIRRF